MRAALRYALLALFAVSGFSGLIYESIWSHYLRNYLGHAAHGQTVVLVIFVGGLALGAWLAGRYTARLREPLLAYAAAELFVGLFALVFHSLYVAMTGWAYESLLPAVCGASSWCATQWLTAALLIALPATALGATFPWMVAGVLRRYPEAPGREISVLYFLNSLGAVGGVLASAYLFIPALGLPGTVRLAGVLNIAIAVAVAAIAWRRRAPLVAEPAVAPVEAAPATKKGKRKAEAAPAPAPAKPAHPPRALVVTFLAAAAITGMASFVYEIVWLRMLSLVLGASTQSFELMLAAFILGLALGGAWIRNRIDRIADVTAFLGRVQVWMAVAAIATLVVYGSLFEVLGYFMVALARSDQGYVLYQVASASIALAVMLPATFLAGMTLPLITYRLWSAGAGERAIGSVYSANTVGAILGVIAAVHLLMPVLGIKGALLAGAAADLLLGIYLLWRPRERAFTWPAFATAMTGLLTLAIVAAAVQPDPRRMASGVYREGRPRIDDGNKILLNTDGKAASVAVVELPTRRILITNGKADASMALPGNKITDDQPTQVLLGALALAAKPDAKRAAVIGMGSGMTSATLLAWPTLARVDTIEIEPRMVDGAKLLTDANAAVFGDPRSHIVYDDAKAWFARAGGAWDIIVSEPSNPWVSGVASLFTEETYARLARQLAPGGVLVQWLQVYEMNPSLLASILRALKTQFPHYVAYSSSGGDLVLIASREGKPVLAVEKLFAVPGMAALLRGVEIASVADLQATWRGDDVAINGLFEMLAAPANSDYAPYVDLNAARARFRRDQVRWFEAPVTGPVPTDVLGATRPRNDRGNALAFALAEALVAAPEVTVVLPPAHAAFEPALRAARELLRSCRPTAPPAVLLEGAIGTAIVINDNFDKASAGRVWAVVRDGACYRGLPMELRRWVDLFVAVAARDTAAMADLGTRLAATAPNEFARDYANAAGAIGELAQNRPEAAKRLLEKYSSEDIPVWVVALRGIAARQGNARQ